MCDGALSGEKCTLYEPVKRNDQEECVADQQKAFVSFLVHERFEARVKHEYDGDLAEFDTEIEGEEGEATAKRVEPKDL